MADEPSSVSIPNLVQGVSQQAAPQRRDTQCEAQFDCTNSPVEGCDARPGARVLRVLTGRDWRNKHFYDIRRSKAEHYLAVSGGGSIDVLDLLDGTPCSVAYQDWTGPFYLQTVDPAKDVLVAATVDDYTFAANRERVPEMAADLSPSRPKEALFYFRAGGYSTTYTAAIIMGGTRYTWSYTTPDNSVSGNAAYIATNQLAATFYRALTGSAAPVASSGSAGSGAGASSEGATGSVGAITASSLGFTVEINGSVLRVYRTDGAEFSVDSSDGNGDAHLKALKDTASNFADLPAKCFDGFVLKVQGEDRTTKDDYYVRFRATGSGGYWEETLASGIAYRLNRSTMPYALINTGYRAFTFGQVAWGDRVAGDLETSKTPSFVGKPIYDIAYDNSRLAIVLEGGVVWSKSRDPFVFFSDTAQTLLAEAPIDHKVSGTREVALIRRMVHKAGLTQLWAEQAQFTVGSGTDGGFKEGNIEIKLSTSYEYSAKCPPYAVAQSLYFPTETDDEDGTTSWTTLRDLYVVGDTRTPPQDTDVTAHVPRYIPAGLRWLTGSDTYGLVIGVCDETPNRLYVYNWLISDNQRVQSAWNTWVLPSACEILWAGIYRGTLKIIAQRGTDVALLAIRLSPRQRDPGVAGAKYATRLDLMVSEAAVSRSYDEGTRRTTIVMPFPIPEATPANFVVVGRSGLLRGYIFTTISVEGTTVVVEGDASDTQLYLGFRVAARRTESPFFLRSEKGAEIVDRLQVIDVTYAHAETAYYRAVVTYANGDVKTVPFEGRMLGDPENEFNTVPIATGFHKVPIMASNTEYSLELVNDSPFPSRWTSARVTYKPVYRSVPRRPA